MDASEAAAILPSLHLNIARCYEDLNEMEPAMKHYNLAQTWSDQLNDDGYGNMIRSAIWRALNRR